MVWLVERADSRKGCTDVPRSCRSRADKKVRDDGWYRKEAVMKSAQGWTSSCTSGSYCRGDVVAGETALQWGGILKMNIRRPATATGTGGEWSPPWRCWNGIPFQGLRNGTKADGGTKTSLCSTKWHGSGDRRGAV